MMPSNIYAAAYITVSTVVLCFALAAPAADLPPNLAPEAEITASGVYSPDYQAAFTANGLIPDPESRNDAGMAWCLPREQALNATLTYRWRTPQSIAAIVYYGRTAWLWDENFREVAVYAQEGTVPVLVQPLAPGHGPQLIALSPPLVTDRLLLQFTKIDSGPNPGASEICLYATVPDRKSLGKYRSSPGTAADYEETPDLHERMRRGDLGFRRVLAVQRRELNPSHVYTYHNEGFLPGGGVYVLEPGRDPERLLDAGEGQILDAELSYDGTEVLLSWRRKESATYHIYRMKIDGSALVQLTDGDHYNFNPCWLPDGDIAFLSTRQSAYAYCWNSPVGVLYRMDRDGDQLTRLSSNYLNDFTPAVLDDGRIIYSRWEYVDRPAIPIQSLWTLHPEGTSLQVYFGNRVLSPATFMEARSIPGTDTVLCLLTAHNGPCRGGVGLLDRRLGVNAQEAIRNLTPEVDIGRVDEGSGNHVRGPYENPFPVDERYFLVSMNGAILLRDYDGTEHATLLRPQAGMGFYNPKPVRPVSPPPVLASSLRTIAGDPDIPLAAVYLQDVYAGLAPHVQPGEIAAVRVVEEIAKPVEISPALRSFGFQFPVVSSGATYAPKRVWGEVEVELDGSAAFLVPAGKPLYFMALDRQGRAVQRMRSFTHFMPGETQTCAGCHEDRSSAPILNRPPAGFRHAPRALTPPEWGEGGFSYRHVVQPVLDRHCVECHHVSDPAGGVDLSGDFTDYFNVSYETLARMGTPAEDSMLGGASQEDFRNPYTRWISTYNGSESNILQVTPKYWGSPASPLADLVLTGHPDASGSPRVHLTESEQRRIFTWIDLNVPYYGTSDSNHRDRQGCRDMRPNEFDRIFQEVAGRRCAACHAPDEQGVPNIPRKWYLRITEPENNTFLTAPLAKAAGGMQACGAAIFESRDDPDYQAILATFGPIQELLKAEPRFDMLETPDTTHACFAQR